jgi:zinc transporter ZupT
MIFAIFILTLAGIIPILVKACKKSASALSYLNCFSAGMFLSIALIHMMPEAVEEYAEYSEANEIERPFPLPFCMMFCGYLIVLLVDRVIMHKLVDLHVGHHHHNEDNNCVIEPKNTAVCIHDENIPEHKSYLPHVHTHSAKTFHAHGHDSKHVVPEPAHNLNVHAYQHSHENSHSHDYDSQAENEKSKFQ